MNDQPKQDVNKEIEEVVVEQEVIDTASEEKIVEEKVPSKKTIKDYLSKDLFADIKVISGKEDEVKTDSVSDDHLEEYEGTFNDI